MGKMKESDSHKMSDGTKKRESARVKYVRHKGEKGQLESKRGESGNWLIFSVFRNKGSPKPVFRHLRQLISHLPTGTLR